MSDPTMPPLAPVAWLLPAVSGGSARRPRPSRATSPRSRPGPGREATPGPRWRAWAAALAAVWTVGTGCGYSLEPLGPAGATTVADALVGPGTDGSDDVDSPDGVPDGTPSPDASR